MALKHPDGPDRRSMATLSVDPMVDRGGGAIPGREIPRESRGGDAACQVIHDELMLDGNARMDLATLVTTWMEPQGAATAGAAAAPSPAPFRAPVHH